MKSNLIKIELRINKYYNGIKINTKITDKFIFTALFGKPFYFNLSCLRPTCAYTLSSEMKQT